MKSRTITLLAKEYDVAISDIKWNESKLKEYITRVDSMDLSSSRKTMKYVQNKQLENALYLWFAQMQSQGTPIFGPILAAKALELNRQLNPNDTTFKTSIGWLKNFKSCHGICQLSIVYIVVLYCEAF